MLTTAIKENMNELIALISQLSTAQFTAPRKVLTGASIGGHYRHIIELFGCLLSGYEAGTVNYDKRERDYDIETKPEVALQKLEYIIDTIEKKNKKIALEQVVEQAQLYIESNYYRELLYNLEHSIHHQAFIKIGVMEYRSVQVPQNFGVAKSTIAYRKQCAQ